MIATQYQFTLIGNDEYGEGFVRVDDGSLDGSTGDKTAKQCCISFHVVHLSGSCRFKYRCEPQCSPKFTAVSARMMLVKPSGAMQIFGSPPDFIAGRTRHASTSSAQVPSPFYQAVALNPAQQ